ncbi:element excision factor XisI family protein [Coleofasciculus chthonoplastes]|jgi:hypothetical protein|uniref:element excision factor XisI family protein n=1 Tax=Coleofasciculus TaxID=669368 RepID=UPI0033005885
MQVHGCLTHVQIIDGKIWIQRDGKMGKVMTVVGAGFTTILSELTLMCLNICHSSKLGTTRMSL